MPSDRNRIPPRGFDEPAEQARFTAAVNEGLADAQAGRVRSHDAVRKRMKAWFGRNKKAK